MGEEVRVRVWRWVVIVSVWAAGSADTAISLPFSFFSIFLGKLRQSTTFLNLPASFNAASLHLLSRAPTSAASWVLSESFGREQDRERRLRVIAALIRLGVD